MKDHSALPGDATDLRNWLDGAYLVVGIHDGDQRGVGPDGASDGIWVHSARTVHRHICDAKAVVALELLAGVQHRMVLNGRGDDMPSRGAAGHRDPAQG